MLNMSPRSESNGPIKRFLQVRSWVISHDSNWKMLRSLISKLLRCIMPLFKDINYLIKHGYKEILLCLFDHFTLNIFFIRLLISNIMLILYYLNVFSYIIYLFFWWFINTIFYSLIMLINYTNKPWNVSLFIFWQVFDKTLYTELNLFETCIIQYLIFWTNDMRHLSCSLAWIASKSNTSNGFQIWWPAWAHEDNTALIT